LKGSVVIQRVITITLTILILFAMVPVLSFACDCSSGPLYKGFALNEDTGYFAREFDKYAPNPGLNWEEASDFWFMNAYQKGWIIKSSPQSARPGALILFTKKYHIGVGIVREVTANEIHFEAFNDHNKMTSYEANFDSLIPSFQFFGYIWPEKEQLTTKQRLIIP